MIQNPAVLNHARTMMIETVGLWNFGLGLLGLSEAADSLRFHYVSPSGRAV